MEYCAQCRNYIASNFQLLEFVQSTSDLKYALYSLKDVYIFSFKFRDFYAVQGVGC